MRNILIIGAGRSASSLIKYLLRKSPQEDLNVTLADLSIELARRKTYNHPNATPIALDINNIEQRQAEIQKADIVILVNGKVKKASMKGNGPVDAVFKAIKKICGEKGKLKLYQVSAVTQGTDSQAEVLVRLETKDGRVINGNAADVDTLVASAKAYINALNRLNS